MNMALISIGHKWQLGTEIFESADVELQSRGCLEEAHSQVETDKSKS